MKKGIVLDGMPTMEWATANLTGHGGTEVDGRWYYTWEQAMAAAEEVGDGWRLPTLDEFKALVELGSVWVGDRKGRVFGGELFLPSAGYINCADGALTCPCDGWGYWSSSPCASGNAGAGYLVFAPGIVCPLSSNLRGGGLSVRLVRNLEYMKR